MESLQRERKTRKASRWLGEGKVSASVDLEAGVVEEGLEADWGGEGRGRREGRGEGGGGEGEGVEEFDACFEGSGCSNLRVSRTTP